jgi:hypothetical protein
LYRGPWPSRRHTPWWGRRRRRRRRERKPRGPDGARGGAGGRSTGCGCADRLTGLVVTARVFSGFVDKTTRLALGRIAASQRGLFSVGQAGEIGVNNDQLFRAQSSGTLRRVRRGVYAMAGVAVSPGEQIVAAALAAGPDAVVSHASAAAVHRFEYGALGIVELTLPRHGRFRPPGVTVHRSTDLATDDIVERNGVPVTSAARTLVDLAGRLGPGITEKLLDEGLIERRWTVEQLQDCLRRARPNVPGRAQLRDLLALRAEGPNADSVLESRVFRALEPLMPFEVHFSTVLGGRVYVIDAAWPADKVGAEVVGRAHRVASRSAFDRERRKLNELGAFGWKIAHLTAVMSAEEMIAAVSSLLGRTASGPVLLYSEKRLLQNPPLTMPGLSPLLTPPPRGRLSPMKAGPVGWLSEAVVLDAGGHAGVAAGGLPGLVHAHEHDRPNHPSPSTAPDRRAVPGHG